jgi:hypothetical protein
VSELRKLLLAWLTLPLTALDWWVAWDRIPSRVVMKTNSNGQPIHWATREEALRFDLLLIAGVLVFLTVIGGLVTALEPAKRRPVSVGLLLVAAFIALVVNGVLWGMKVE